MPAIIDPSSAPLIVRGVNKTFRRETGETVRALEDVSLSVPRGALAALVGPDGAGKTTLIRLICGLMSVDAGAITALGIDVAGSPQEVQSRVAYMPQKFGLYEDLTVAENLNLYADLHGVTRAGRAERYPRLMEMTNLARFTGRLAGRLSGGMKQKLGIACTLISAPELLLLDEPTVGVDPLSRRELWAIIEQLVGEGLTVLVSTSYLDEAERCGQVTVMHEGRVLAAGDPADIAKLAEGRTFVALPPSGQPARELQSRWLDDAAVIDAVPEAGRVRVVLRQAEDAARVFGGTPAEPVSPRFEEGFMVVLRGATGARHAEIGVAAAARPIVAGGTEKPVIEVHDMVRQFGAFTAVNHVNFQVRRGEIFGLLGPNGAGKTTTFRMLCGLLPATGGTLRVAGVDVRHARAEARQRLGYVAQKFSLYGQLTVDENLDFFASAYGLRGKRKRDRIAWAVDEFHLGDLARLPAGQLPGGYKQRLAMAAALLHEPEILFLDEPTSGADPVTRREFWRRITALAAGGVTVIVTTHFMEEAEYCDHAVIMDSGRVLAEGTPAELRAHAVASGERPPTMEEAFIAIVDRARAKPAAVGGAA